MISFPVYDSNYKPTNFQDGLMTYVKASYDGAGSDDSLFLLCTTCTMSYIFGVPPEGDAIKSTDNMSFKTGTTVPVSFVSREMSLVDSTDTTVTWT